jgi:hypothetical protein
VVSYEPNGSLWPTPAFLRNDTAESGHLQDPAVLSAVRAPSPVLVESAHSWVRDAGRGNPFSSNLGSTRFSFFLPSRICHPSSGDARIAGGRKSGDNGTGQLQNSIPPVLMGRKPLQTNSISEGLWNLHRHMAICRAHSTLHDVTTARLPSVRLPTMMHRVKPPQRGGRWVMNL